MLERVTMYHSQSPGQRLFTFRCNCHGNYMLMQNECFHFVFNPVESIVWAFFWNRTNLMREEQNNENTRITGCSYVFNISEVYESTFFFFFLKIIPPWWVVSLPWKRSKHPKCDAPATTKYLIIVTSFSGRLCLHLHVSLSNLEMTDWQRGLSAFLHEKEIRWCVYNPTSLHSLLLF